MATTIAGGQKDQPWVARGAVQRAFTRHAGTVAVLALAVSIFLCGLLAWSVTIPRQIPVTVHERADGTWVPAQNEVTADDASRRTMILHWIGSWRLGCNVPKSQCAKETKAMVSTPDVAAIVQAHNQEVADRRETIVPVVQSITGSDTQFTVNWDEQVSQPHDPTFSRSLRAFITIAFSPDLVSLGVDPLLNPYGEYLSAIQITEMH